MRAESGPSAASAAPPLAAGAPPPGVAAGSPRYFAWLYSPAGTREALAALFGIEHEIGASLQSGVDHRVAHVRLEWWREELGRCAAGTPVHPLTRELLARCRAAGGPAPDLRGLTDAATWDLASAVFESRAELGGYCGRWAAAMTQIAAECALAGSGAVAEFGRSAGAALREIELLVALDAEARRGRLRLPLDELEGAGVAPETVARPPWSAGLAALVRARHRALRASLAQCVARLTPDQQPPLRGIIVWVALAWRQSWRAEQALPESPGRRRAAALADAWHAWRTARRASAGRFRIHEESSS